MSKKINKRNKEGLWEPRFHIQVKLIYNRENWKAKQVEYTERAGFEILSEIQFEVMIFHDIKKQSLLRQVNPATHSASCVRRRSY